MARTVYFVCSTPGSLGNFVGRVLRGLHADENAVIIPKPVFENEPEVLTREYFFNNLSLPEEGTFIVHAPFRPDFETMKSRFPGCKIVVITHSVQESTHLAKIFFKTFFVNDYEAGAEPFFRKVLTDHNWIFSNVNATPADLTKKEKEVFVRIIAYQKLLDGFHSLTIPTDPDVLEIKFGDLIFKVPQIETALENFTSKVMLASDKAINSEIMQMFLIDYFNLTTRDL